MNWSALDVADVPPTVVTRTSAAPALLLGLVAVIDVALLTVKLVAAVMPKVMPLALLKLVPVMVTLVPPAIGPAVGETPVTAGAAVKVKWSALEGAVAPPGVVTTTSTVPADAPGLVADIDVALLTVKLLAAVLPKVTALAEVRLVPVMVTLVPPLSGPEVGETAVTVGAEA